MGHIHLGVLPSTKKWRQVVGLLAHGAPDEEVIAASAIAAERDLNKAVYDPVFVEAVRLLGMIPYAAREENFGRALRDLGIPVSDAPDLSELLTGVGRWLDRFAARSEARSDFGELARRALLGTLSARIGSELPGLLEAEPADVKRAAARMSGGQDFALAARAFFGRLTADTLASWLDRTLSAHVGPGQRFVHTGERAAFDAELDHFCAEATRIIREFSGGWYWKTLQREGRVETADAVGFAAIAFRKIVEELHRKRA